jgi:hypothetical protein
MISIETRKKHTKNITNYVEDSLFKVTNNNALSGYIVFILHNMLTLATVAYILVGDINWIFYVSYILVITMFLGHMYFAGCIITRIERTLWKSNEWNGPWITIFRPLEMVGIEMTRGLANSIFNCSAIILSMVWFLRLLYNMN